MPAETLKPKLEILGVYRLEVTKDIFEAQLPMYGDEAQCRDHFSSVVLIEALVQNPSDRFSLSDFHQPISSIPNL
jgi:hypothetical protein